MIKEGDFNGKQRLLYETMSDISEDCYCAGWMCGNEVALWRALQDGNLTYGMGEIDADELELCGALAKNLHGWIIWIDGEAEPDLISSEWGPRFVDMEIWLHMFGVVEKARKVEGDGN